jgi:REP element-mobilizing transposase RayT
MPRPLRIDIAGQAYHVTQHGIDDMALFRDDVDRERFLMLLADEAAQSSWTCLAYCLMTTHYHLLVRPNKATLSSGFQRLNGRYARQFNRRHNRRGHLFQDRFRDRLIESEAHRLEAARYIHLNAPRAIRDLAPESYPWSDYGSTVGLYGPDFVVDVRAALEPFGSDLEQARLNYRAFVDEADRRARRGQTVVSEGPL